MGIAWANVVWRHTWWGVRSMLVDYEPHRVVPPHVHPEEHIYVLTRGTYCAAVDGAAPVSCRPGAIVFRPARQAHWDQISPEGCTSVRLELPPICRPWLPTGPGYCFSESLAERCAVLAQQQQTSRRERARAYVELFTLLWDMRVRLLECGSRAWVVRLLDLLAHGERAVEFSTPERVAARVGVGRSTLQEWAFRHGGVAIGRLLRQARVLSAAQRVVGSSTPLASIAVDLGYADQSHLTREFRSWLGTTPGCLRGNGSTDEGNGSQRTVATPKR